MVKSCSAPNCSERFDKNSVYSFHRFPKDENKRKKWEISLRKINFKATDSSFLCSKHFPEDLFYTTINGRRYLKDNAVPTLFDFPKPIKLPQAFGDSNTLSEMVRSCCVEGCKTVYEKGGCFTFHQFPKDEVYRKKWVAQLLKRENFVVTVHTKICSKHFKEECFDRLKFGGTWLKKDAIPTIFSNCNSPKWPTVVKESGPQVKLETVFPSSNGLIVQNQGSTVPTGSNISNIQNQGITFEEETILPTLNIPSFQNQVNGETILPDLNISSFQNQVKMEVESLSESESSPPEKQTIVTPISQNQSDVFKKKKRKFYLSDYDENDMHSPYKAMRVLALSKARDEIQRKEMQKLRRKNKLMARKIKSLKKILNELTSKKLKEVRKVSKKDRDKTSVCIEDVAEEIAMLINNPSLADSESSSDSEDNSFRFLSERLQRSTASSRCSSSVPTMNKHKEPDEEIQTEGGQSQ